MEHFKLTPIGVIVDNSLSGYDFILFPPTYKDSSTFQVFYRTLNIENLMTNRHFRVIFVTLFGVVQSKL